MDAIRRIDKWLWEVRVFKTRSQATQACRSGHVFIGEQAVKASRELNEGDEIVVRQPPLTRHFVVLGFPGNRVGAPRVPEFMEETTPREEFEKMKQIRETNFERRERGFGRPTKRERREIDALKKHWKP